MAFGWEGRIALRARLVVLFGFCLREVRTAFGENWEKSWLFRVDFGCEKAELLCGRDWLFCLGFACEKPEPLLGKIRRKVGYSAWVLGEEAGLLCG